jgi:histidine triad (HIT) family protein
MLEVFTMSEVHTEHCPFCTIEPERIIHSGELFVSLLSNPRLRRGHTLIIPRRHVETPTDLRSHELQAIYTEIPRVQTCMIGTLATGCDTWQKYQPFVPQGRIKIDHVHFHVLPRDPDDRLFMTPEESQLDVFEPLESSEQTEMLALLRKGLERQAE